MPAVNAQSASESQAPAVRPTAEMHVNPLAEEDWHIPAHLLGRASPLAGAVAELDLLMLDLKRGFGGAALDASAPHPVHDAGAVHGWHAPLGDDDSSWPVSSSITKASLLAESQELLSMTTRLAAALPALADALPDSVHQAAGSISGPVVRSTSSATGHGMQVCAGCC